MERTSHQNRDDTNDFNRRVHADNIEKVTILSFNYPVLLQG